MGGDCLGRLQSEGPERGPGEEPGGARHLSCLLDVAQVGHQTEMQQDGL